MDTKKLTRRQLLLAVLAAPFVPRAPFAARIPPVVPPLDIDRIIHESAVRLAERIDMDLMRVYTLYCTNGGAIAIRLDEPQGKAVEYVPLSDMTR